MRKKYPTRSLTEVAGWIKLACQRCARAFWSVPAQAEHTLFCCDECRHEPWEVRLFKNIVKGNNPDDCWTFKLAANVNGYPCIKKDGKQERVLRIMWEYYNGPIPEGMVVRHKRECNNHKCVRIDHLQIGTQQQNIEDREALGTTAKGEKSGQSKLTEEQVREARLLRETQTLKALSEKYGVSISTVDNACKGITWKHIDISGTAGLNPS